MSSSLRVQIVFDVHGLGFTCSQPESLNAYNKSIDHFLALTDWTGDGNGVLSQALEHDEMFFMGYIYIAFHLIRGRGTAPNLIKHDSRIASIIGKCDALRTKIVPLHPFQRREVFYLEAVKCSFRGQTKNALKALRQIVEFNAFDILAILLLHYGYMSMGDIAGTMRSIRCVITDFERKRPATLPYIQGLYSMALQEQRDYQRAWEYAHLSLVSDPYIVSSFHSKIHILQEIGHDVMAIRCCSEHKGHWRSNQKTPHVAWHWMVSNVEVGRYREALRLFDSWFTMRGSDGVELKDNVHCRDAVSFLWRMDLNQYELDSDLKNEINFRWDLCRKYIDEQLHHRHVDVYGDSYFLMNLIRNQPEEAIQFLSSLKLKSKQHRKEKSEHSYFTETAPMAAIPIYEGMINGFVHKQYAKGFEQMHNVIVTEDNNWRMGGSTAQKEIFSMTMMEMAYRAGKYSKWKSLMMEHLECRPIWNCTALNQLARYYQKVERDQVTADMYWKLKDQVLQLQHSTVDKSSLNKFPVQSMHRNASKL